MCDVQVLVCTKLPVKFGGQRKGRNFQWGVVSSSKKKMLGSRGATVYLSNRVLAGSVKVNWEIILIGHHFYFSMEEGQFLPITDTRKLFDRNNCAIKKMDECL